jgi:hypothetical protein
MTMWIEVTPAVQIVMVFGVAGILFFLYQLYYLARDIIRLKKQGKKIGWKELKEI